MQINGRADKLHPGETLSGVKQKRYPIGKLINGPQHFSAEDPPAEGF
jgi:hypothetical protein